jgi:hypothetical protein
MATRRDKSKPGKRAPARAGGRPNSRQVPRSSPRLGLGPYRWFGGVLIVAAIAALIWWRSAGDNDVSATRSLLVAGEDLPDVPGLSGPGYNETVEERIRRKQASADNWDTEVFNEQAGDQLSHFGESFNMEGDARNNALSGIVSPAFESHALRPAELVRVFSDAAATVVRQDSQAIGNGNPRRGLIGAAELIDELVAPFGGPGDVHTKFKVVFIETNTEGFATTVFYHASAQLDNQPPVQQNAVWKCQWTQASPDAPPLVHSIRVEEFEEVTGPQHNNKMFADCTGSVLGANKSFTEQLLPGLDHWRARIDRVTGINVYGHEGLAVGDVNGDGLDDVFFCQPGGLPNRLFVQNLDGTATDVSAQAGVDLLDHCRAVLILDLDNDGHQDLLITVSNHLLIYRNNGAARFESPTMVAVPNADGLSAADYDQDGDLDLYICGYLSPDQLHSVPVPFHDADNGRRNVLLRNDGRDGWTDVTAKTGLEMNNRRFSFASSWDDYDNDGDLDLYVANDFGRNNLYRNDGGRFTDVAAEAGVEDISAGMSVSWGDYNRDGLMDLYVSNMFSSAGNRITYQRQFQTSADSSIRSLFQRHARGNTLFRNLGNGTFADVSEEAGVTMGRWAWSSNFIDFNNDGYEDIFVANGYVTNQGTGDL